MALSAKLVLRQGQTLVLTPQLLQAIKLLQLSHFELMAHVEAELETNPLLERGGDGAEDGFEGADERPDDLREPAPLSADTPVDPADWGQPDSGLQP